MRRVLFASIVIFSIFCHHSLAQRASSRLDLYADSLSALARIMETSPDNEERIKESMHFSEMLGKVLLMPESFSYKFDSLRSLSKLNDSEHTFRLYTWMMNNNDKSLYQYFGFVQIKDEKTQAIRLVQLHDSTEIISEPAMAKLNSSKWYGAYYFKLIEHGTGKKRQFTLLGWKGDGLLSTKKIIDCMTFKDGNILFGSSVFPAAERKEKRSKKMYCRLIFEYSNEAIMAMRYELVGDMIVFDHLSPPDPSMTEMRNSYGPDLSFDALAYKKGKWIYLPDVDARNLNNTKGKARSKHSEEPIYKPKE